MPSQSLWLVRIKLWLSRSLGYDWLFATIVILLIIFGLYFLSTSTDYSANFFGQSNYLIVNQLRWLIVGVIGVILLAIMDYHLLIRLAVPLFGVVLLLTIVAIVLSGSNFQASRTLFQGSIRTSELSVFGVIIYSSVWICSKLDWVRRGDINALFSLMIIFGVTAGLMVIQPDMGSALMVLLIAGLLAWCSGWKKPQLILVMFTSIAIGFLFLNIYPTGKARLDEYLSGITNLNNSSRHVIEAVSAIKLGGWFGQGPIYKADGLPVPYTDSAFAMFTKSFGAAGSAILLSVYGLLAFRAYRIAIKSADLLGSLLAIGFSAKILIEVFVHVGSVVGLLPFIGASLPFISYGGSNLLINLLGIGILLNISRGKKLALQKSNSIRQPRRDELTEFLRRLLP
jgi:cell division protein FtsW